MRAKSQNVYEPAQKALYFQIDEQGCQWLNRKVAKKSVSRKSYMSQDAAEALAHSFFQPIMEQCEKDSQLVLKEDARRICGDAIAEGLSGTPGHMAYLHPEDIEVLDRMGVSFGKIRHVEITEVLE
jgi:hypothetical protein